MSDDEVEFVREVKKRKTLPPKIQEESEEEEEYDEEDEEQESEEEEEVSTAREKIFSDPKYSQKFTAFTKQLLGDWEIYNTTESKEGTISFKKSSERKDYINIEFNVGYEGEDTGQCHLKSNHKSGKARLKWRFLGTDAEG